MLNSSKRLFRNRFWYLALTLLWPLVAGRGLFGQATDPATGHIKSDSNWLVLGPFKNPFACTSNAGDFLTLHLAPSSIHNMAPEDGDEVDYDPAQASTTEYLGPPGPNGLPQWRLFADGTDDGDINLDADITGGLSDVMSYLVTYVEYLGAGDTEIKLCVGSDDGVQVWWDTELVHNLSACRGRGTTADPPIRCQDLAGPVKVKPGVHRIAMGIWERGGGWGGSLALDTLAGQPILHGNPEWRFLGADPAGLRFPKNPVPRREITVPGDPDRCPPPSGGPVSVLLTQPLEGRHPDDLLKVVEEVKGSFGPGAIFNTAGDPAVTPLGKALDLTPVGDLADWEVILTAPDCSGTPGESSCSYNPAEKSYTLKNIGEDIWWNGDSFTFAYLKVRGDFQFTAHIKDRVFVPGSRWGKHGLMARQDLSNRSRYSFAHDQGEDPRDETRWAGRQTHGGSDNFEISEVIPDGEHHDYLRLERRGNVFTGLSWDGQSVDGNGNPSWIQLGDHDWGAGAPEAVLVGLALTSHTTECGQSPTAITFDEVRLDLMGGASIVPLTTTPETGGARLEWTARRGDLDSPGLSHRIALDAGIADFYGTVDGERIFGDVYARILSPARELGPIDLNRDNQPEFDHLHMIGEPCPGAAAAASPAGEITLTGAGTGIWSDGDQFLFAYKEFTGDFSAQATFGDKKFTPNTDWGMHGLMARQGCSTRARYSFIHDNGGNPAYGITFSARPTHGGRDNYLTHGPFKESDHLNTIRLDRCGSEFRAYALDTEGKAGLSCEWALVASHDWGPDAPDTVQIGLAVTTFQSCEPTIITFKDWIVTPECEGSEILSCKAPVYDLICQNNGGGGLDLSWKNYDFADFAIPIEIQVNGKKMKAVPGDATSVTLAASELEVGVNTIRVVNFSGQAVQCGYFKGEELAVNCGGPRLAPGLGAYDLGDGRIWEEDSSLNPSPFLKTAGSYNADFSLGFIPPFKTADTSLTAPLGFIDHPARSRLFATERWKDGDLEYAIPLERGDYEVTLLFAEGCCSSGCEDLPDPELSSGPCRVFDIYVNGELVEDQFAQHVVASRKAGEPLPNSRWGVALAMGPYRVEDTEVVDILIQDLGFKNNPPENSSLKGIHLKKARAPQPRFRRGDADASGVVDISDPINNLTYQFLGTFQTTCLDALDDDDSGAIDISDPIYSLTRQFVGGPPQPPPGPERCGEDPTPETPENLGCEGECR